MRQAIRNFLYAQLDEEPGLTSCLIIHTINKDHERVRFNNFEYFLSDNVFSNKMFVFGNWSNIWGFSSFYKFFKHTLYNVILRIAKYFLKTRENIKISTHPFYHTNLDWFSWEWSKKKFFFEEKNSKWPIFQNGRFSKSPILEIFSRKFHRSVLGLVGLIDAKPINVAQPMWSWGCLT